MNALILDFYGTAVSKNGLDSLIESYIGKTDNGKIDYDRGGSKLLEEINNNNEKAIEKTQSIFFEGVKELYNKSIHADLEVLVYSNGHREFIEKSFELNNMSVRAIDPKSVGDKKNPDSYRMIRHQEGLEYIIVVNDSKEEIDAAIEGEVDKAVYVDANNPDYTEAEETIDEIGEGAESLEVEADAAEA
tara:strand:- start:5441 stop:6007 length:567 start_codon:yes stop_codon:yes gene_type:complete